MKTASGKTQASETKMPWNTEFSLQVWNVLTEECGAPVGGHTQKSFMFSATKEGILEFRFCGNLGLGGKLYPGPPPYVTCYLEDKNPERDASIQRANRRLEQLWANLPRVD